MKDVVTISDWENNDNRDLLHAIVKLIILGIRGN